MRDNHLMANALTRGMSVWPVIVLASASGVYFALMIFLAIDWNDEGQIVYFSSRVAEGALPYRDFHHVYGPSLFLLNGWLFRLFGEDLLVTRSLLVLVKCATVVLVFLLARRVSSLPIAMGTGLLLTAVWGADWPFFSTPYSSFFAIPLGLLAIHLILDRGGSITAYLLAGACLGLAMTFKQTTGAFVCLAITAHAMTTRGAAGEETPERKSTGASSLVVCGGILLVIGLFAVAILDRTGHVLDALFLGAPLLIFLGGQFRQGGGISTMRGHTLEAVHRVVALGVGVAGPLLLCGSYFAYHGAFGALVSDTILDLPAAITLLVRPPPPHLGAVLCGSFLILVLLALRKLSTRRPAAPLFGAAALVALLATALYFRLESGGKASQWWGELPFGVFELIPMIVALCVIESLRRTTGSRGDREVSDAQRLFAALGALGLLNLVPATDSWHIFLALPIFLPTIAGALEAALPAPACRFRVLALVLIGTSMLPLAYRFGDPSNLFTRMPTTKLDRATGLRLEYSEDLDGVALVHFLDSPPQRDRPIFVLTAQHMLYFLSDRESPIDEEEFILYLIGFDLISPEEVTRRVDEDGIVSALEHERPIVIEEVARRGPRRVRAMLPDVGRFVDRHYHESRRFGRFRVLDRARP